MDDILNAFKRKRCVLGGASDIPSHRFLSSTENLLRASDAG